MRIAEYDDVDPHQVLRLNLLSLGWALTPERVALIRRIDPRPFPFFAVYAVEGGVVAGQVGAYRLPMVSTEGPEVVGGVCAVCTHPAFSGRGIATMLLGEAHHRMRAAGLRFSTLGTARHRAAHSLYRREGYEEVAASASTFARCESLRRDTPLRAERAGAERLALTDNIFRRAAAGRLGFARRSESFIALVAAIGDVNPDDVWLLGDGKDWIGYAIARVSDGILTISDLVLIDEADAANAGAAMIRETDSVYAMARVEDSFTAASLQRAGFPPPHPDWGTFMIKPLTTGANVDDARRLFGIGTERFIKSWMDVT